MSDSWEGRSPAFRKATERLASQTKDLAPNDFIKFNVLDLSLTAEELEELGAMVAVANQAWSSFNESIIDSWKREDGVS